MSIKMKEVGTLTEIGAEVGDVVEWLGDYMRYVDYVEYTIEQVTFDVRGIPVYRAVGQLNGWEHLAANDQWRIVRKAKRQSPVRVVMRKEIVPGVYGRLKVRRADIGLTIGMVRHKEPITAEELTAAIETLTQIRDAMNEN